MDIHVILFGNGHLILLNDVLALKPVLFPDFIVGLVALFLLPQLVLVAFPFILFPDFLVELLYFLLEEFFIDLVDLLHPFILNLKNHALHYQFFHFPIHEAALVTEWSTAVLSLD